jgi:acyl-CoA thioester hydrolase
VSASYRHPVRVYYEDTDFSGNVYHAAYLHFFERGRTEFLRALGIHHSELIEKGVAFAVRSMEVDFPRAAHIDDELVVDTAVLEITGARLTLDQSIERRDELIARARVVVAAITTAGKATRLPRGLMSALARTAVRET